MTSPAAPPNDLNPSNLRPTERVEQFLKVEMQRSSATGKRLPTIKQISELLDVGVSTVQGVFTRLSKEGQLMSIPGKGTYVTEVTRRAPQGHQHVVTVSIHGHRLTGAQSTWGKEICAGILHQIAAEQMEMVMRPFFVDQEHAPGKLEAEVNLASGAIVFPSPHRQKLVSAFRAQGKPVIYINPPNLTSSENFVAPNFYQAARRLAKCWRATGRKHVVVIMHRPLIQNTTSAYTLAGFQAELDHRTDGGAPVMLSHFCVLDRQRDMAPLLASLFAQEQPPDAIHATGDHHASDAVEWLLDHGIAVPGQVSVTGGTGLHPTPGAARICSVVEQPLETVGRCAVQALTRALQGDSTSQPGQFITAPFRAGETTREEENHFLTRPKRLGRL